MNDKVSVIIPTYNCYNTLEKSIISVLNQSYPYIEIIIIDDFSKDNTNLILRKYKKYHNIIIIKNKKNYGKFVSVNKGIQKSNGIYITILDADDIYHPEKIKNQITVFKLFDKCVATQHDIMIKELDGESKFKKKSEITIMFKKKEILETIGYFHPNRFGSDTEFIERLYKYFDKNKIIFINKILYYSVKRYNSLTTNKITGLNSISRLIFINNYKKWHRNTNNLYIDFPLINNPF